MDLDLGALDRDGHLAVPGVLTAEAAREAVARSSARAADPASLGPQDKVHGGTIHLDLAGRDPVVDVVAGHPGVRAVVAHLLGDAAVLAHIAFREPQPGFGEQQLHADALPLERVGPAEGVTAIVALADFTVANGATVVVPGSHARPDQQRPAARGRLGAHEVALTGPVGTAFLFSAHILHRGARNRSARARPSIQAIWRAS